MKQHCITDAVISTGKKAIRTTLQSILLGIASLAAAQVSLAADFYIDGVNGNNRNPGTKSAPFLDVWRGWQFAKPGDTIRLLPTTVYGPLYFGTQRGGSPGAQITIRGEGVAPNMTKVSGKGINSGIYLEEGSNYITIQNLDITAPGNGDAAGWSAIFLKKNHHIDIDGNYVHDSGCSGIQTTSSDYVSIKMNRVANNAYYTGTNIFCSGISTHENLDSNGQSGTKMWILNNIVYNNRNITAPNCTICRNSDGNGIIIDDNQRTQTDSRAYNGKTLVQSNVIFNNGGRGIAIYYSNNVDVLGNTVFKNNQDKNEGAWSPGEVGITYSGGINVFGNIMYSDGVYMDKLVGNHYAISVTDNAKGAPINVDHNLMYVSNNASAFKVFTRYNTVPVTIGANNKWADPIFKNASLDPATANFQVKYGSPATAFPIPLAAAPKSDINWRSRGQSVTLGAYQLPVN